MKMRYLNQVIPLTEATYLILLCLYQGPKHGYAIMKDVESFSDGRVRFSTGTLYGALKRLLHDEWIKRIEKPTPPDHKRGRKSYALTDLGQKVFLAEYKRLQSLMDITKNRTAEEGASFIS